MIKLRKKCVFRMEVKPEYLPEWAKERLAIVKQEHAARRALAEAKKHKKARGTECER